jgi:hypothetical protein
LREHGENGEKNSVFSVSSCSRFFPVSASICGELRTCLRRAALGILRVHYEIRRLRKCLIIRALQKSAFFRIFPLTIRAYMLIFIRMREVDMKGGSLLSLLDRERLAESTAWQAAALQSARGSMSKRLPQRSFHHSRPPVFSPAPSQPNKGK